MFCITPSCIRDELSRAGGHNSRCNSSGFWTAASFLEKLIRSASMRARVYKPAIYFRNWRSQIEASIPIPTRRISFKSPLDQRMQTTIFLVFSSAPGFALGSPTRLANQDIEGARNQAVLHKYQNLPLVSSHFFLAI
jgi:hypothetical protein